jgi:hypothetical protein
METGQRVIFDSGNNCKLIVIEPKQFRQTLKLKQSCEELDRKSPIS